MGASDQVDGQMGSVVIRETSSPEPKSPFQLLAGQRTSSASAQHLTSDVQSKIDSLLAEYQNSCLSVPQQAPRLGGGVQDRFGFLACGESLNYKTDVVRRSGQHQIR